MKGASNICRLTQFITLANIGNVIYTVHPASLEFIVSRTFPAYHPKAGQETDFVEKILVSIGFVDPIKWCDKTVPDPKHHTIRAGNRWEAGDMASLRYLDGRPYHSKQVEFAQVEIKKVWPIEIRPVKTGDSTANVSFFVNGEVIEADVLHRLSKNDGLSLGDLVDWFIPEGTRFIIGIPIFTGQIICWSDKVNY